MTEEEKFRNKLRNLVESKEFEFSEKDWDRAAAYLHQRRSGKNLIIGAAFTLLCVLLGGIIYLQSDFTGNDSELSLEQETSVSAEPLNKTEITSVTERNVVKMGKPAASSKDLAITHVKLPSAKSSVKINRIKKTHPDQQTANPSNDLPASSDQHLTAKVSIQKQNDAEQASTPDVMDEPFTEAVPVHVSIRKRLQEEQPAATEDKSEEGQPEPTAETADIASDQPREEPVQVVTAGRDSIVEPAAEKPIEEPVTVSEPSTVIADPTSTITSSQAQLSYLSIEVGPSYHFGWKEQGIQEASGLNACAGIHYNNPVSNKVFMSVGIQYQRTAGLGLFTHQSKVTRFSFGEESDVMMITPRKLHYIAAPIRFHYHVNNKTAFGAAYTIAYLLDVESETSSYSVKAGHTLNEHSYRTRGYTDGFSIFDNQLAVFYRRNIWGGFSAQAEIYLGLSDVKDNGFFPAGRSQRNSGLRLLLQYNFGNKR